MVGVQDEQHLERLDQPRVGLVGRLAHLEQHGQEVGRVGEPVVGVDVRLALLVPVDERTQRRHLGDHPGDLRLPDIGVGDGARIGIEGGQRTDRGHQHAHRVRVVAEPLDELLAVLVQEGVVRDVVHPLVQLTLSRQVAVQQQVGHLQEGGVLGQLLDGVAPVLQDSLISVDVGDGAATRGCVDEAWVVRREARVALTGGDLLEIRRPDRAVRDRELVVASGPVVADAERVRHSRNLRGARPPRPVGSG